MSVTRWRRGDGDGGERSRRWRGWWVMGSSDGEAEREMMVLMLREGDGDGR